MNCFVSNVEACAFMKGTFLGNTLRVICITANNGFHRSVMFNNFLMKRNVFRTLENGTFFLDYARDSRHGKQRVSPFYQDLGLELVGVIGNFKIVEQLVHQVVEQILNPILSSSHG